jgi:hypothetical protein
VILYSSHQYTRTILNTYLVGKNMKMSSISLIFIMTIVFFQSGKLKLFHLKQCHVNYIFSGSQRSVAMLLLLLHVSGTLTS